MPRRRILCSGWEAAEKRRRRIVRQRLNEFDQLHPHPSEVVVEAAVAASGNTSAPFPDDATDLLDDSCIFSDNCDATSVQTVELPFLIVGGGVVEYMSLYHFLLCPFVFSRVPTLQATFGVFDRLYASIITTATETTMCVQSSRKSRWITVRAPT